jgi:hypothetical protein
MIAALATKDGVEITITGETVCAHRFHRDGTGATLPVDVGGGWRMAHCPIPDCDTVTAIHEVMDMALDVADE